MRVTAEFLRSINADVPEHVPDCAECDLAAVDFEGMELNYEQLNVKLQIALASPFRWSQQRIELEDGTVITAVWPPEEAHE